LNFGLDKIYGIAYYPGEETGKRTSPHYFYFLSPRPLSIMLKMFFDDLKRRKIKPHSY
jgi:hypothetical protein